MGRSKVVLNTGEVLIDLTKDTVAADKLTKGFTAHDKAGNEITGTNTYDVDSSELTATASEILDGKTAAVGGQVLTGTMPNNGAVDKTISSVDDVITIPIGFHDGSGTVAISETEKAKLIPSNIRQGVELMGQVGEYTGAAEVTAQAKEVTPTFEAQTVMPDSGYDYLTQVTVKPITITETENAAGGITVTIGG